MVLVKIIKKILLFKVKIIIYIIMKKCPYIKWYETINKVYIDILNYSNNSVINIENNNLDYSDNLYEIKTELFSDCELDKYFYKNNTTTIILNKMYNLLQMYIHF